MLAWRFAQRITAEDLAEMLREAVFRRFGATRLAAQGIAFLSGNGPEYTSYHFRPFVQAIGLLPCPTPRRSPESNGLAEAFSGSLGRDYVYQACLGDPPRGAASTPRLTSCTTITRRRTAPWACAHPPGTLRHGSSTTANYLPKPRWGSAFSTMADDPFEVANVSE